MGTGGVGGYFGGRLAIAGHDVQFIARGDHLRAIQQSGLRVVSPEGDFMVSPAQATDDPASVGPVDLTIVSVKSWQLPEAARQMRPMVGSETAVLPLLNGVEATDELAKVLPPTQILGGLCRIIASIEAPGHIRHAALRPSVTLGELDNQVSTRVQSLHEALTEADIESEIAPDIRAALWEKFMLICTWSGIGAVTRSPVGVWRSLPETRAMAEASLEETLAVARGLGVALAPDQGAMTMTLIDAVPPPVSPLCTETSKEVKLRSWSPRAALW